MACRSNQSKVEPGRKAAPDIDLKLLLGGADRDDRQTQNSTNQPSGQTLSSPTSTTGTSSDGPHMLDKSFSGTYDDSSDTTGRSTKK